MKYGWLNIDKPCGVSSGYVVARIKSLLKCKVGHAGTLDPLATGVLPIAFGEATKTVNFVCDASKSYLVTVQWGQQRDTDDAEGRITGTSDLKPSLQSIEKALSSFIGDIEQVPPKFSALKVNGVRAYKLSRQGREVALGPRKVSILEIKLLSTDEMSNTADLLVSCKKGVYIRALARDLGISLGCLGYVAKLRRTEVGAFSEENAITLDELEVIFKEGKLERVAFPISYVMKNITRIDVDESITRQLRHGKSVSIKSVNLNGLYVVENCDICYLGQASGVPVAICRIVGGVVKPVCVFNV